MLQSSFSDLSLYVNIEPKRYIEKAANIKGRIIKIHTKNKIWRKQTMQGRKETAKKTKLELMEK